MTSVESIISSHHLTEKFPLTSHYEFFETQFLVKLYRENRQCFDELLSFYKSCDNNTSLSGSHTVDALVREKKLSL